MWNTFKVQVVNLEKKMWNFNKKWEYRFIEFLIYNLFKIKTTEDFFSKDLYCFSKYFSFIRALVIISSLATPLVTKKFNYYWRFLCFFGCSFLREPQTFLSKRHWLKQHFKNELYTNKETLCCEGWPQSINQSINQSIFFFHQNEFTWNL